MSTLPSEHEEHILSDFETELDPANRNLRFVNFIVDRGVFFIAMKGFNIFWMDFQRRFMMDDTDYNTRYAITIILGLILYGLFTGLTEAVFKGKTLGKLITGTRVVNPNGTTISVRTALIRGLIRIIPFEPFSAFGGSWPRPWHDKWPDTYVVVEKTSVLPGV